MFKKTKGAPFVNKSSQPVRSSSFGQTQGVTLKIDARNGANASTKADPRPSTTSHKATAETVPVVKTPLRKGRAGNFAVKNDKFNRLLNGDMSDVPSIPKSMVKIFLSSTFSDMREERNILAREGFPKLRDYCFKQGLDFQVVDMRWGITDECQNDHSVEKLCLLEVDNCQKSSWGPNFVVLSGDRYGFRPIPTEIEVAEFETLKGVANTLKLGNSHLLSEWYKLDENMVPSQYILQPIRSKFPFFADFSPGCDDLRKKATSDWWKTFEALQGLLRACAEEAYKNRNLTEDQRHNYFLSVTECEIQAGILQRKENNDHCLVYKRVLTQLQGPSLSEENATRFIDTKTTAAGVEVNDEVSALKDQLFTKISKKLNSNNIKTYTVPWVPGGVNSKDHKHYLDQFCQSFVEDCEKLIQKALEGRTTINESSYYSNYEEITHHLNFCLRKCESFCGQEQILEAAKAYILDDSSRKPFVIQAASGLGKTSIMAMIMKSIPTWLHNQSHTKMIRFLGTSAKSSKIEDVLFSVLGQVADASNNIISPIEYRTMKSLLEFFPRRLKQYANSLKEPVIILLDSLDQLSPHHNAYAMKWLPLQLPPYVKLIVSTLPEEHNILANIQKLLPERECYVEVPALAEATAKLIAETYLKGNKRVLGKSQMVLLLNIFKGAPSPLFLKLLLDEAKTWNSYTPVANIVLAPTVKTAINKLFEGLEKKFGVELVSHALGYITVGLEGLSAFELEDVLSVDDVVLNDVYRYHDPPVPGIVRIPPLLWARIWYDIKEYLVERLSYGKNTLNWYHRQFWETASERYTGPGKAEKLHKNLTDLYLQESGICKTITLTNRKNLVVTDANRMVTPQPFSIENKRKLACLTFHAIRAYPALDLNVAKSKIFCNFKYLCTRTEAFSLKSAIESLDDFLELKPDEEVSLLKSFLYHSKENLSSPSRLAFCLLAYIQPEDGHTNLKSLLEEARDFLCSQNGSLLVPEFPCLTARNDSSSSQEASLNGFSSVLGVSKNMVLLRCEQNKKETEDMNEGFAIFNTVSQDLQQVDFTGQPSPMKETLISISEDTIVYGFENGIVTFDSEQSQATVSSLTDLVPTKKEKLGRAIRWAANTEGTFTAITFRTCIALIDVQRTVLVSKFKCQQDTVAEQTVTYLTSDEDPQLIVIGQMEKANSEGSEKQHFVSLFQKGSQGPVKSIETIAQLDAEKATFVAEDSWFVVAAEQTDGKNECQAQLVRVKMDPFSQEKPIDINGKIVKVEGRSGFPETALLSEDGTFFLVDVQKGTCKLSVNLDNPVTNFAVFWERLTVLLGCSGQITLYDLEKNKSLTTFPAHKKPVEAIEVMEDQCITLSTESELKMWNVQTLIEGTHQETNNAYGNNKTTLLDQMDVVSMDISRNGKELLICTFDGRLCIWDLESHELLREFSLGLTGDMMSVLNDDTAVLLDRTLKVMQMVQLETGTVVMTTSELPKNALYYIISKDKHSIFIVSSTSKDHAQVDVVNVGLRKVAKTIGIKKSFSYESLDGVLSANERYMVLRAGINEKEFQSVKAMWKKGGFGEQPHHYKFLALDLSQANGVLIPCFRQLSKIPTLGVCIEPYAGNTMIIASRVYTLFWDIPTGKCDQKKQVQKFPMLDRTTWLSKGCDKATTVVLRSTNNKFIAVGSEDGYLFIYEAESGKPVGGKKPQSKHRAPVTRIAISADNKWVSSSCKCCTLKLWDSHTGKECFSVQLDALVQGMTFSPDSKKLVLFTGSQTTRVCVFGVNVC